MGPTEPWKAADIARRDVMYAIGCIVSLVFLRKPETQGTIHHLKSGNKRIGHQATICLSAWFHDGIPPEILHAGRIQQLTVSEATRMFGPSLAHNPQQFHERFGTDEELLEMQNTLIAKYQEMEQAA